MNLLSNYHTEDKPWGSGEFFTLNELSTVKTLKVNPGKRFSLQKHKHRSEWWKVIQGSGIAHVGTEERSVARGDVVEIQQGELHRLTGGPEGITVLEISFGHYDDHDIERVEDDYGRM